MNHIATRPIRSGDKVAHDKSKVHLGDNAPIFSPRPIRSGDKVVRDTTTLNQGKVCLGDNAPIFAR